MLRTLQKWKHHRPELGRGIREFHSHLRQAAIRRPKARNAPLPFVARSQVDQHQPLAHGDLGCEQHERPGGTDRNCEGLFSERFVFERFATNKQRNVPQHIADCAAGPFPAVLNLRPAWARLSPLGQARSHQRPERPKIFAGARQQRFELGILRTAARGRKMRVAWWKPANGTGPLSPEAGTCSRRLAVVWTASGEAPAGWSLAFSSRYNLNVREVGALYGQIPNCQ